MFDDLEEALDNTDYTPSFVPRQQTRKPLNRQPSPAVSQPPLPSKTYTPPAEEVTQRRPGTLLGLHKANSIQSKSQERTIPNKPTTPNPSKTTDWDVPLPDLQFRPTSRNAPVPVEEPSAPIQRGMRPPLNRKNSEKSIGMSSETPHLDLNLNLTQPLNQTQPLFQTQQLNQTLKMSDHDLGKIKEMYEQQLKSQKQFYEKQLKDQRSLFETRLKQAKSEFQNSKSVLAFAHKEELKLKLQLKDVQIEKLKQMHKLELQTKTDQLNEIKKLKEEGEKLNKKGEVVELWEKKLKNQTDELSKREEERLDKTRKDIQQRQNNLNQREKEIEAREKECREELKKEKKLLQGEYQRLQSLQESIVKDRNKFERDFSLKQQTMRGQIQQIKRQYSKKSQDLQLLKSNVEHEKSLVKDSQTHYQKKLAELNAQRQQLIRSCDQDKRRTSQKQIELQGKLRAAIVRESQIDYLKDQLKGKTQLLELQRKRAAIQVQVKQKPEVARDTLIRTFYNKDLEQRAKKVERANSQVKNQPSLNKSLTELKNSYLKGLEQLRGQGALTGGFRLATFNNFK